MNIPGLEVCPRCHGDKWGMDFDWRNLCIGMICRDCGGEVFFDVSPEVDDFDDC